MRNALAEELGRRLEALARTAASQVSAADVREAQLLGEEGNGYLALQVLLEAPGASIGRMRELLLESLAADLGIAQRPQKRTSAALAASIPSRPRLASSGT